METSQPYIHDTEIHRTKDAELIVPILIEKFQPQSILDVGCGTGTFLRVFLDNNISDVQGIEGPWLDEAKLLVPKDRIVITDISKGFSLNRKFDIAICLEVAEHLAEIHAAQLVRSLTAHSDVIVFSAAIPAQGGQNHINEQWIGYWQELFTGEGFKMYDIIRPQIWNIREIYWWYRQNIVVCIRSTLNHHFIEVPVHNYIHPELYVSRVAELRAYKQWVNNIFSGKIEVEIAQTILKNAMANQDPIK